MRALEEQAAVGLGVSTPHIAWIAGEGVVLDHDLSAVINDQIVVIGEVEGVAADHDAACMLDVGVYHHIADHIASNCEPAWDFSFSTSD